MREVGRGHHHRRLQRAAQAREVDAGVDVRRVRRADEHGVRGLRRPAREIGGAEIGGVEFGAGDLGDAVDAAGTGGRRVPALPSRQRLARLECGFLAPAAKRDKLSAMPLAVTHFTNSRRDGRMLASSSALQCLSRAHFSANRHPSGSNGIAEAHGDVLYGWWSQPVNATPILNR